MWSCGELTDGMRGGESASTHRTPPRTRPRCPGNACDLREPQPAGRCAISLATSQGSAQVRSGFAAPGTRARTGPLPPLAMVRDSYRCERPYRATAYIQGRSRQWGSHAVDTRPCQRRPGRQRVLRGVRLRDTHVGGNGRTSPLHQVRSERRTRVEEHDAGGGSGCAAAYRPSASAPVAIKGGSCSRPGSPAVRTGPADG